MGFLFALFVLATLAIALPVVIAFALWRAVGRLSRRVDALEARLTAAPIPPVPAAAPVVVAEPVALEPPAQSTTPEPEPEPAPLPALVAPPPAESWELVVGISWLNKIGVLVFVMGMALLVGYSFTHIGPAGRIAVGYVVSAVLLVAAVRLERRPELRTYAYGLLGGGWAGLYFTTFAMHAIPGARILESDLTAVLLLAIVAAGMIVHSLRYQSQTVTALAYVVAYATLALSPLSGFALAASLPLAASVLIVSQRLGWPRLAALGIAATYGTFVLRDAAYPGGVMDPYGSLPYVALAAYWLTFEGVDIAGVWLRRRSGRGVIDSGTPMLALNTAGALGALLVTVPGDDPRLFSSALFVVGTAHLASAVVRATLSPRDVATDEPPFDRTHWATALAAALFVWAVAVRFTGTRESLALALLTQLLFAGGRILADVWIRRMASVTAAVATVHVAAHALYADATLTVLGDVRATSVVAGVLTLAWYSNAEILHRHEARRAWLEPAYSWMATALAGTIISAELVPAHQGLAGLALAWVLLEAAVRRGAGFAYQSAIAGVLGTYAMLLAFVVPPGYTGVLRGWGPAPTPLDDWTVLPAGMLIAGLMARRLTTTAGLDATGQTRLAAATASTTAVVLLLLFERRVLPPIYLGPAWTATGVLLVSLGLWRPTVLSRWQGYAALLLGVSAAAHHVFDVPAPSARAIVLLVAVIAALYACSVTVGRAARGAARGAQTDGDPGEGERFVAAALSLTATGMLFSLILQEVRPSLVTLAFGLQGLALMAVGLVARERIMRLSGLGLLLVCILKLFLYDLRELDALARILSFVALGLILLAISWIYTRYRDQISKLL